MTGKPLAGRENADRRLAEVTATVATPVSDFTGAENSPVGRRVIRRTDPVRRAGALPPPYAETGQHDTGAMADLGHAGAAADAVQRHLTCGDTGKELPAAAGRWPEAGFAAAGRAPRPAEDSTIGDEPRRGRRRGRGEIREEAAMCVVRIPRGAAIDLFRGQRGTRPRRGSSAPESGAGKWPALRDGERRTPARSGPVRACEKSDPGRASDGGRPALRHPGNSSRRTAGTTSGIRSRAPARPVSRIAEPAAQGRGIRR